DNQRPIGVRLFLAGSNDQLRGNEAVERGRYERFAWREWIFLRKIVSAAELPDLGSSPRNLFFVEAVEIGNLAFLRVHREAFRQFLAVSRIKRPRQKHRQKFALAGFSLAPLRMEIVVTVGRAFNDDFRSWQIGN